MQWFFWFIAILLSLGAGYIVYRADNKRNAPYPQVTATLRAITWFLVISLLLAPSFTITRQEIEKPVVVWLQDNSMSVAHALQGDSSAYRQQASELQSKLRATYRVDTWGFDADARIRDSLFSYTGQATDIAAALEKVSNAYAGRNIGAVILASDGRFNQGSNPLYQRLPIEAPVFTIGLGDTILQKDIRITKVYANAKVPHNSRFEVRADLIAQLCAGYRGHLRLSKDGQLLASSEVYIQTDRYDATPSFQITAETPGVHHYVLQVTPADAETNLANNRKDFFVEVFEEKRKVFIAASAPHPDIRAIRDALTGTENYTVTMSANGDLPKDIASYDAVVIYNMNLSGSQQAQLKDIPIWFVLGDRMPLLVVNQMQHSAVIRPGVGEQEVRPEYCTSFYQMMLPSDILAVTDKLPPLYRSVGDIQLSPNAAVLFGQQSTQGAQPLWWLQQGSRPVAVLAGTGLWRWRMYEYHFFKQHTTIDECIRQTMSFLTTDVKEEPFRVLLSKHIWSDREPVMFQAYLLNANNESINIPEVSLLLTDSTGKQESYVFDRSGTSYRLQLGILPAGDYVFSSKFVYQERTYRDGGQLVVSNTPAELMEVGADYALLYGLAHQYQGAFVTSAHTLSLYDSIAHRAQMQPVIHVFTESLPLIDWKWYFFLILLFAAGEWLLRKYWMAL